MKKGIYVLVVCLGLQCLCATITEGQNNGILYLTEDFTDTLFPKPDWITDAVTRVTTPGSFQSPPAAASFGAHTGSLTLPPVNSPVMVKFYLGRTTTSTAKTLILEASTESNLTGFVPVDTFDHSNTISGGFVLCETDLSAFSGPQDVWIRFRKESTTTSPWRLDDIEVYYAPGLPVSLNSFYGGWSNDKGVSLYWQTATEYQNAFFGIQRSAEGSDFVTIGRVTGQGTVTHSVDYHFNDPVPDHPVSYYRLIQQDFDGHAAYSPVIQIKTGIAQQPVLTIQSLKASINGVILTLGNPSSEPFGIYITDLKGLKIFDGWVKQQDQSDIHIKTNLIPGVYVLSVFNTGHICTRKFFVDF